MEEKRQRYLTTEQRRSALKLAYTDRNWVNKVEKMPDIQVYAIFDKFRKDGMINFDDNGNIFFRSKEEVKELKKRREESRNGHQITLDEFMTEITEGIKEENNRKENK